MTTTHCRRNKSPHFQDFCPACSLGSPHAHDHEGDTIVMALRPIHTPYLHTCTYTHNAEPLPNCPMSTSMLVTTQHYLQLGNPQKPQQRAILEMLFNPNLQTDIDSFPVQTCRRTDRIQMQFSSVSSESTM